MAGGGVTGGIVAGLIIAGGAMAGLIVAGGAVAMMADGAVITIGGGVVIGGVAMTKGTPTDGMTVAGTDAEAITVPSVDKAGDSTFDCVSAVPAVDEVASAAGTLTCCCPASWFGKLDAVVASSVAPPQAMSISELDKMKG